MVHIITGDDGELNFEGVAIAAAHGFTGHGLAYAPALGLMGHRSFSIAVDLLGHGGTDGLSWTGYRLSVYSELFAVTLRALGIKKVIILGHSLGARVATGLAVKHRDLVLGVIWVNGIVGSHWDHVVNLSHIPPFGGLIIPKIVRELQQEYAHCVAGVRANPITSGIADGIADRYREIFHRFHILPLLPGASAIITGRNSMAELHQVVQLGIPVFPVWGNHDKVIVEQDARSVAQAAGTTVQVVDGGEHFWPVSAPSAVAHVMDQMLAPGHLFRAHLDKTVKAMRLNPATATAAAVNRKCVNQRLLRSIFDQADRC